MQNPAIFLRTLKEMRQFSHIKLPISDSKLNNFSLNSKIRQICFFGWRIKYRFHTKKYAAKNEVEIIPCGQGCGEALVGVVDADISGPTKVHVQGYSGRRFILDYHRRPRVTILQNQRKHYSKRLFLHIWKKSSPKNSLLPNKEFFRTKLPVGVVVTEISKLISMRSFLWFLLWICENYIFV